MSFVNITSAKPPVPVVLLIGDFRNTSSSFARLAWQRVVKAYKEAGESFGPAPALSSNILKWADISTFKVARLVDRTSGPALYPFPISDDDRAHCLDFQKHLFRCFYYFDVCAVISCNTAKNTKALLQALEGIDVPFFITIDSTLAEIPRTGLNILRLVPNNSLQAQAILSKVGAWHEATPDGDVEVFYDNLHDEYVADILSALSITSQDATDHIELRECSNVERLKAREEPGLVVCVGYYQTVEKLIPAVKRGTRVVMSDGCYDERVRQLITERQQETYFWTHTLSESAEYAEDAYWAACATWNHFRHRGRNSIEPQAQLKTFTSSVQELLERRYSKKYKFLGSNNQRGGYVIEPVDRDAALKLRIVSSKAS